MAQIVLLKVHLILLFATLTSSTFTGVRLELTHVDSDKGGLTKSELLQRAAGQDQLRRRSLVEKLSSTDITAPVTFASVSYYITLTIGTPPLPTTLFVDTGSDLIWTQCVSCTECVPQSTPLYDPSKSSTFAKLSCNGTLCRALPNFSCSPDCKYSYTYGDGGSTQGFLATETFGFGPTNPVSLPSIGFGCGVVNIGPVDNASGIIGLSRGPL
ncbi:aspartic proteinase nepenthesin-1-like [Ananas comosus]|uniref:Aspartic proteinase nepenthesin-1-like n=1 Tax=Ananas comosus TaxID=4615 RepID=A0A6P5FAB4_ANACO|nr:aspartic proteinase nepenthesin-1-like [Ananas comosus]